MIDQDLVAPAAPSAENVRTGTPKKRSRIGRYLLIGALTFGALAVYGILDRNHSDAELSKWTDQQAIPSVDLVSPKQAAQGEHLTLPASIEAMYTAPIHSQVSGYVKMWYHDIGAHVKANEILARIDAPELDQQLERAKGELEKAQADFNLATLTADRWKMLRASQAVSQQTADEKAGDALAQKAQVLASQANLDRVKALANFKNIVAPFDGVVTSRRIDIGALVSSTNTSAAGLFDVSDLTKMRIYVQVPQIHAAAMKKGLPVSLMMPQYPGKTFVGKIDTTSGAISQQSRALLVEALFDNADGQLTPGAYAQAYFELPIDPSKLVVPSASIIFRNEHPEVAVVTDGKVALKQITIALDTGSEIEIATGLDKADKIVASPPDSIETGDDVKVAKIDGKPVKDGKPYPGKTAVNNKANGSHEASE